MRRPAEMEDRPDPPENGENQESSGKTDGESAASRNRDRLAPRWLRDFQSTLDRIDSVDGDLYGEVSRLLRRAQRSLRERYEDAGERSGPGGERERKGIGPGRVAVGTIVKEEEDEEGRLNRETVTDSPILKEACTRALSRTRGRCSFCSDEAHGVVLNTAFDGDELTDITGDDLVPLCSICSSLARFARLNAAFWENAGSHLIEMIEWIRDEHPTCEICGQCSSCHCECGSEEPPEKLN